MWLCTVYGFYSVASADKPGTKEIDPDTVMVRARSRRHLENLRQRFEFLDAYKIMELANRDYGYRMIMPKEVWARAVNDLVMEQDWSNFKNECHKNRVEIGDDYISCLHRVWSVMLSIQPWSIFKKERDPYEGLFSRPSSTRPMSKKERKRLLSACRCGHSLVSHGVTNPQCLLCSCPRFTRAKKADLTSSVNMVPSDDLPLEEPEGLLVEEQVDDRTAGYADYLRSTRSEEDRISLSDSLDDEGETGDSSGV